nr:putative ribonuclease H protein At1g65750 family [Tanacetum cinerariifolium]
MSTLDATILRLNSYDFDNQVYKFDKFLEKFRFPVLKTCDGLPNLDSVVVAFAGITKIAGEKIMFDDLMIFYRAFFVNGSFSKGYNSSFIALIPKVIDVEFVNDYRPISLIGSVYKFVTKIMANRLAFVIEDIVSDTQSAFVAERQILDGPFILNEVLQWCKRKNKKAMFLKLILPRLMIRAANDGLFKGIRLHSTLSLSHLFYADDTLFIGEWSDVNLQGIIYILKCFYLASGLQINISKSQVMGVGVSRSSVEDMAACIGCSIMETKFRYLGVMIGECMSRHKAWDDVVVKLRQRLDYLF